MGKKVKSELIIPNSNLKIDLARHPYYHEIKTGDMFTTWGGPRAVVLGLMKDLPGIEGIHYCTVNELAGYAPLLYFEGAGEWNGWSSRKEGINLMSSTGIAGLSEKDWELGNGIAGCFKYFEEARAVFDPAEMLQKARNYLTSDTPIYSFQDVESSQTEQRDFIEKHRQGLAKFLENCLC